ncbi:MAG: hypothetical protein EXQ52_14130 [Bryobacterales bacterium]|nr:hypothetical protein [Bryobacterales bacterium]
MSRSVAFYRDLIGLKLRFETPEWSEFETEGCTLALHKAAEGSVAPVEDGKIPAGHMHPGFGVDDIDEFAARMKTAGVPEMREVRQEDFGGRMGVWLDPDGLPVSVASCQG